LIIVSAIVIISTPETAQVEHMKRVIFAEFSIWIKYTYKRKSIYVNTVYIIREVPFVSGLVRNGDANYTRGDDILVLL